MNVSKFEFVFVILHFLAIEDTVECLNSIREKCVNDKYMIVVVDNGSYDDSYLALLREYEFAQDVVLLHSNNNLGFAKGNNLGFTYAKDNFNPEYIILLNSDTLILQPDFCDKIRREFSRSHFFVLGPLILNADGKCNSNPIADTMYDETLVENDIRKFNKRLKLIRCKLYKPVMLIGRLIDRNGKRSNKLYSKIPFWRRLEDVKLHGSCLVFSKLYVNSYDGLNPNTFLYEEESILFYEMKRDCHKTVYNPDIMIYHKEDASTNQLQLDKTEKLKFRYKNEINSLQVLLELMKTSKNK